jgi:hypothetical protein
MRCILPKETTIVTYEGERERATSTGNCRPVSEDVQKYSVQYKGYNLIGVTTVKGGATRGTTALVYY